MSKCAHCGMESRPDVEFHFDRRFGRKVQAYCGPCWGEQSRKIFGRRSLLELFLTVVILTVFLGPATAMRAGVLLLWAAVSFVLSIVIHELGHALAAWVLGLRVFRICIGSGSPLLSVSIGGLDVEWRALPLMGLTTVTPKNGRGIYPKQAFVLLCGPLFNVLAAGLAFWLLPSHRVFPVRFSGMMFFLNGLAFLIGIIPRQIRTSQGLATSDSMALFKIKSLPQFRPEIAIASRYSCEADRLRKLGRLNEARAWLDEGGRVFPGNPILEDTRALILMDEGKYEDARDLLTRALGDNRLDPIVRPGIANNLAWVNILCGRPELLQETIALAKEAFEASPPIPAVLSTHGLALILGGEIEDGLDALFRAFREEAGPRERASIACSIAYGETKRGSVERSRIYLEQARRLDPQCPLFNVLFPEPATEVAVSRS